MEPVRLLTKSLFQNGLRCFRLLWFRVQRPEQFSEESPSQAQRDGIAIGDLAKCLHPSGVEIDWSIFSKGLRDTQLGMDRRRILFEAGFVANGCHARADILLPGERDGSWDIWEVKSSSLDPEEEGARAEVRRFQLYDLAFQKFCYTAAGVSIGRTGLLLLNKDYVRYGELHPAQLFLEKDETESVDALLPSLPPLVEEMQKILGQEDEPPIAIQWNCRKNGRRENRCDCRENCPLKEECWTRAGIGAENITILPRFRGAGHLERGIWNLSDFQDRDTLSEGQKIVFDGARSGKIRLVGPAIRDWLGALEYPIHYLDFETFASPIPPFDGTHAYSRIPFQFSLHVQRLPGEKLEQMGFLARDRDDPRPNFLKALHRHCEDRGSVIVYNAAFEKSILRELGECFPDWRSWTEELGGRIVDLYEIFRQYHYYSPAQLGSRSIKKVLPALTGQSYCALRIGNGEDAMGEYRRVTFSDATADEREEVYSALEEYCALDTRAMADIISALGAILSPDYPCNGAE
ncbi:MAG: DUF2779 domain-containing protein [Puniceicoccales bacterium]|nr:DUF2779 domain-containing protein [Puniceicoccales bacterium]